MEQDDNLPAAVPAPEEMETEQSELAVRSIQQSSSLPAFALTEITCEQISVDKVQGFDSTQTAAFADFEGGYILPNYRISGNRVYPVNWWVTKDGNRQPPQECKHFQLFQFKDIFLYGYYFYKSDVAPRDAKWWWPPEFSG